MVLPGLENRVIGHPFCVGAHRRDNVLGPVHVVIGRRHDIGPVGLDVGEMAQPGLVSGLLDELDATIGQIRCFGVFFGHPRWLVGMLEQPA